MANQGGNPNMQQGYGGAPPGQQQMMQGGMPPPPPGQPYVYTQGMPPPGQPYMQGMPPPGQPYMQGIPPPPPGLQNVQQQWVPKPEPITGVPPGLEYLTQVDQLLIKQQIELLEAFTGWETANKYKITNTQAQQVFFAAEGTMIIHVITWFLPFLVLTLHNSAYGYYKAGMQAPRL